MSRQLDFGGVAVRETTTRALTRFLEARRCASRPVMIGFANHNFIVACRHLAAGVRDRRGILLVNDGIGLQTAAALRYGAGFRENMNGTDFVPHFLKTAKRELSVYLLGGRPEVVVRAAGVIAALPGRSVAGTCDGYSLWDREAAIVDEINRLRPDVLLVGLGNPRQEAWILAHRHRLDVEIVFAVGALFEWMSQSRRRAPRLIRRARLEWAYRLCLEPRRLLRRYTLDVAVFFWLVLVKRNARQA